MNISTAKDKRELLLKGVDILAPILVPHGFCFSLVACGSSSNGPFAQGEFISGEKRLELHLRHTLGMVTYHWGKLSLSHEAYLRALLGQSSAGHFPGFSTFAHKPEIDFERLRDDLVEYCSDFVSGAGDVFRECVNKQKQYESLSPFQKMELGSS